MTEDYIKETTRKTREMDKQNPSELDQLKQQLAAMKLKLNDLTGAELGAYVNVGAEIALLNEKITLIMDHLGIKFKEKK